MKTTLALSAALLVGSLASADTVVTRDGRQYNGTFVNGNSARITITDRSGARRDFDARDVSQILFGDQGYSSRNRTMDAAPVPSGDEAAALRQLRDDLRGVMRNPNLNASERQSLRDAERAVSQAQYNVENNRAVDYDNLRNSIRSMRSVMSDDVLSESDRDMLRNDLGQLRRARANNYDWIDNYRQQQ